MPAPGLGAASSMLDATDPGQTFCTMEIMIGPNGEECSRDPALGCKFVDSDGRIVPGQ
jgi:hypothetical protein